MPAFIREAVALVVLVFHFLVLELQFKSQDFRGFYLSSTSRSRGERDLFCFKLLLERRGALDGRGHGPKTNCGFKPFYTEILLKIGGKRTSGYLEVRSITLSVWF